MPRNDDSATSTRRVSTAAVILGVLAASLAAAASVFLLWCMLWFFNAWFPIW